MGFLMAYELNDLVNIELGGQNFGNHKIVFIVKKGTRSYIDPLCRERVFLDCNIEEDGYCLDGLRESMDGKESYCLYSEKQLTLVSLLNNFNSF